MVGTEKTISFHIKAGNATIKLENMAREIFMGSQQAVLNIAPIRGVNSYTLEMLAEALASSGTASLIVNTALGSITIPSGMLSTMKGIKGKTASIIIAAGNESKLPADVKAAIGNRPVLQLTLTLDVPDSAWYYRAVNFIAARGITFGTGNSNFSPVAYRQRRKVIDGF